MPTGIRALAAALPPLLALGLSAGLAPASAAPQGAEGVALPAPPKTGNVSLEEALWQRRSGRDLRHDPLKLDEIARLSWAAQGASAPNRRTAPSAGALYPLDLYVAARAVDGLAPGLYRYSSRAHRLEALAGGSATGGLASASAQAWLGRAPAIFAITGTVARSAAKYGERAERYVHLEAGHAAQNLLLEATALGLCATSVGSFDDARLSGVLRLPPVEAPLYLIPVGRCARH